MIFEQFTLIDSIGGVLSKGAMMSPHDVYDSVGTVIDECAPDGTYWTGTAWAALKNFDTDNTLSSTSWVSDGTTVLTYGSNLPNPTKVNIVCDNPAFIQHSGSYVEVTDGSLDLTTTTPGNYTITVMSTIHNPKIITITAS